MSKFFLPGSEAGDSWVAQRAAEEGDTWAGPAHSCWLSSPHRFLKALLQLTENLVSYTSPEKNKWDEAIGLVSRAMYRVWSAAERQQMLMYSPQAPPSPAE